MDNKLAIEIHTGQSLILHLSEWGPGRPWGTYQVSSTDERERYIEVCLTNSDNPEDTVTLRIERS